MTTLAASSASFRVFDTFCTSSGDSRLACSALTTDVVNASICRRSSDDHRPHPETPIASARRSVVIRIDTAQPPDLRGLQIIWEVGP